MAGSITVSSITLDSDNNFSIKSNTGATLFFANTTGIDVANSFASSSITSDKILTVANTKISGNIISSQITSVANTQITGNIISSQITSIGGSQITANTIANSAIQTGAVENYMNATGLSFGMRNRIINGAMVIDQRNAGAAITGTTSLLYSIDRFNTLVNTDGTMTFQQVSDAPTGFTYSLKATATTADASLAATQRAILFQRIEGYNVSDLMLGSANAVQFTASFWVKSSLTGTFGGSFQNVNSDRAYPFTYTISSASTWEKKTVTITGDTTGTWNTTNGSGLQIVWGLGVGSTFSGTAGAWAAGDFNSATGATSVIGTLNATWQVTGVQLEKGSTATSFDYRPYSSEFSMCQRYYQKCDSFSGAGNTTTNWIGLFTLQQTMRTTPSIGQSGVVYISDYVSNDIVQSSASASVINTGGGGTAMCCYLFNYSGMTAGKFYASRMLNSNYVTFSAEL
jgi:hypothetical protein